jgi:putative ABC transport system permease protein
VISWAIISFLFINFTAVQYRIVLTPVPFLMGGLIAFVIALVTVMYQTFSAALSDPVEALKQE